MCFPLELCSYVLACGGGCDVFAFVTGSWFQEHQVFKRYLALCTGRVEPAEGSPNSRHLPLQHGSIWDGKGNQKTINGLV